MWSFLKEKLDPCIEVCNTAIVSCIDFRFQGFIRKWAENNIENNVYDHIAVAGASKHLAFLQHQVGISVELHKVNHLVIINHEDCGEYGKAGTYERHILDLRKARRLMSKTYPKLQVDTYYLHLDGTFEAIN